MALPREARWELAKVIKLDYESKRESKWRRRLFSQTKAIISLLLGIAGFFIILKGVDASGRIGNVAIIAGVVLVGTGVRRSFSQTGALIGLVLGMSGLIIIVKSLEASDRRGYITIIAGVILIGMGLASMIRRLGEIP